MDTTDAPPPRKKIKCSHEGVGQTAKVNPQLPFEIREQIWKELALATLVNVQGPKRMVPAAFDYHSDFSVRLGHIFSIVAKTVLASNFIDVELWNKLDLHICSTYCALAEIPKFTTDRLTLALSDDSVRKEVWAFIKKMYEKVVADKESKQAEEGEKRAKLHKARRSRKVQKEPKSAELIDDKLESLIDDVVEEQVEVPDNVTIMSEVLERTTLTLTAEKGRTVKRIGRKEDTLDHEQSDEDEVMEDPTIDEDVDMTEVTLQPTSLPDDTGAGVETVLKKRKAGPEKDVAQKRVKTGDDGQRNPSLGFDHHPAAFPRIPVRNSPRGHLRYALQGGSPQLLRARRSPLRIRPVTCTKTSS
ncbi:hypothetical protein BKA56DRAFT_657579 [Ilyonectria sp. MPI-CAGE-AT-0026]|nr:hypothetical protein BKA56DRAFT_657579 [Ilyonectria sp. MPI-CAGE-AT-0026]